MNKQSTLWGLLLIAFGVVLGLNALGIADIDLFFGGWWTLFLVVPGLSGILSGRKRRGDLVMLAVGLVLLAMCRGWLDLRLIWKLAWPTVLVLAGAWLLIGSFRRDSEAKAYVAARDREPNTPECCAAFSGRDVTFRELLFRGAELTAVFGRLRCDPTGARFDRDVILRADAIFGVVEIIVPAHMQVRIVGSSCFGGIRERAAHSGDAEALTVYVDGMCLFGGVKIL